MNNNKEYVKLYNYTTDVDYLAINNKDKSLLYYQNSIKKILYLNNNNNNNEFMNKCDLVYEFINIQDKDFMNQFLYLVLNMNDNSTKLSNNMYFYMCVSSVVKVDTTKDFNINEYINNDKFRKLVFGFLFNYDCFQYLHTILIWYFTCNAHNIDDICEKINTLSKQFVDIF